MRLSQVLSLITLAVALTGAGSHSASIRDRVYTSRYDNVLGTSLDLKMAAQSPVQARQAELAVLHEVDRQSHILSSWSPESEFSSWLRTRNQPVAVSEELFEILGLYDQWRVRTNGALSASAGQVINLWKEAERAGRVPSADALTAAITVAGAPQWTLDPQQRTATHIGNASLILASFTKSYIIDRAADAALREGLRGVVMNVGGDIVIRGEAAELVDIADPHDDSENGPPISQVLLRDSAVATSGNYRRGFDIAGRHYSHIVDPRTAMPVENIVSSTVIAPRAADAGALATAFSILTPDESAKLAASIPGVAYLLVKANGERIASPQWAGFESRRPVPAPQVAAAARPAPFRMPITSRLGIARAAAVGTPWDPTMELTINFELAPIGGATKRPFMAAWIEDADHFQVRTLAVWYHEDRWVTEMKAWFRSDRMRAMADGKEIFRSISSATRPPGKYSLKWDGKDNDGKPVKNGKYTICLEVVREHGTYQFVKQEMDLTGTPKVFTFPANTEVVSASFDYHKIAH